MPQYCFQFFRCCPARIAEVNFVVTAVPGEISLIALFPRKSIHLLQRLWFGIIRANMHTLHTKSLIIVEELYFGEILLLFCSRFLNGPIEHFPGHEIRHPD